VQIDELEVSGHAGEPIPCVFYEGGREGVAVVFPGAIRGGGRLGGSPARPDLHYTRALLLELGLGVLEVWWNAETRPRGREEWYRDNALAAIAAAGPERVRLLVARSLGTAALTHVPEWNHVPSLWIAPLTSVASVRVALAGWRGPRLAIAGDADEVYEPVAGVETMLVPGADHALAVGDPAASARLLADILDRMRLWLSAEVLRAAGP
jgi:hypothetical protein